MYIFINVAVTTAAYFNKMLNVSCQKSALKLHVYQNL